MSEHSNHSAPVSCERLSEVGGRGVLVVGVGGLASPALEVLVRSGLTRVTLVDDDRVEDSNLQRQTLFTEADVGRLKVDAAADRLGEMSRGRVVCEKVVDRFVPDNALSLVEGHHLVLEGADNFATKFLAADAAKLAGVSLAQAGVVRFSGWSLGSAGVGEGPCLRCFFEDIPREMPETCAVAGVMGSVVGVVGALQSAVAIELLVGKASAGGTLFSYEALSGKLRKRKIARRPRCPLCTGEISDLSPSRYLGNCAA